MGGAFNQMGGAMQGMPGAGFAGGAGAKPTMRNAFVFGLLPELVWFFLPQIVNGVANAIDLPILYSLSGLFNLAAIVWLLLNTLKALNEMRNAAGNPTFPRWPIFIPIYSWIYFISMVPKEVMKAKQMAGRPPTHKSVALYFFFHCFALQSDLNEIAAGGGAPGGYPGQPGGYPGQPYG